MNLSVRPRAPFSAYIESFWFYQGNAPAQAKERRLPDGALSLIINLGDDQIRLYDRCDPQRSQSWRGGVMSGAHSDFILIDAARLTSVIGVQFRPGGVSPWLPLPAAELHNTVVSLDMLWGTQATELRERLLEARTTAQRFELLEAFLLAHLIQAPANQRAIMLALQLFRAPFVRPGVADVAEQLGLSQTGLRQAFREIVGLTPKQFCRVQRFQEVLCLLESGTQIDWAELAQRCGYYDQAHFIHDFQAFSGLTPGTYLSLRGEYRNHVSFYE